MTIDLAVLAERAMSRTDLWSSFLREIGATDVAEVGVFRGAFAEAILGSCPAIERYYMIDPWRHLEGWDKPANKGDDTFQKFLEETLERTSDYAAKRIVLRGKTTEVSNEIPHESLDFAYIDGDHTLRGITVDLIRLWPKIKLGGWLGGDDLRPSIFHHGANFEPTLVFPWSVHFAEGVGTPITALPFRQFLMEKQTEKPFEFVQLVPGYDKTTLKEQYEAWIGSQPPEQAVSSVGEWQSGGFGRS